MCIRDRGTIGQGDIAVAASGEEISVGGVRLRGIIGSYPALVIASAPHPWPLALGALLFLAGLVPLRSWKQPARSASEQSVTPVTL